MFKYATLEEVQASIKPGQPLAFDTETAGKYGKICLAQFYQSHWDKVLMVKNPEPLLLTAYLMQLEDNTLVMQLASYDITTLQRQTGSRFIPHKFDDTLLMARIHWPQLMSYTLDELLTKHLGYDPYDALGIDKKAMQKAKWDVITIPQAQLMYAAIDVYHLLDMYETMADSLNDFSYQLDIISLREALDFQNNGMVVDKSRLEDMYVSNQQKIEEYNVPINVNSWKQVRPYIGSDMSDGLGLTTLMLQGNKRAEAVLRVRKLLKLNSFLNKFDTLDGKIYGVFGPYARSGRYTCSDQNLEQLPRKTKPLFGIEPDRFMLYSDFSQLELRGIACITSDYRLLEVYYSGGDIHTFVAETLGISRQIAKTINFNALYGGGVNMMRSILIKDAELLLDHDVVTRELRKWKNLFSGVTAWQQKGIRDFNGGRLGSTACGRKYRGRLMTDQLNIENQGTGAEVAKLAMHYMYPDLIANDCRLMNFIHDSYIIDAPNDKTIYIKVAKRIAEAMQEAWREVTQLLPVKDLPMPVSVYGGYNWGDIEEGSYTYEYTI
jgi:DNA polymerase I-like protein with 3'-5' exonuclease and polymerase domains